MKGQLIISMNLIYFEPSPLHPSQTTLKEKLDEQGLKLEEYNCCIDFRDVVSVQKLRGINQSNEKIEDLEMKLEISNTIKSACK